jgi:SpoIID/LytB domain protein
MLPAAIDHPGTITRVHALLVTGACALLLLLSLPAGQNHWGVFSSSNSNSFANESDVDVALQQSADAAMDQREGVIVVIDAQTGRIRASVNLEGAYTQSMMPGSTIKPFTTLAAMRAGLIDEDSRTTCPGRFTGLSFSLPCVHADHLPPFTPSQAIAYSCNYYFATLGQRLGREKLIETLRQFGFGQVTRLNETEAAGVMKPCETGGRALIRTAEANHGSEQGDCTAREAIGESDHIQVTPMQLLTAFVALLNGGHLYRPQTASVRDFNPIERARIELSQQEHQIVSDGMEGAVRYGTARKARLDALPLYVLGKTGTSLPAKGFRNNGWFVGLAGPLQSARKAAPQDLKLAVLVFLPRSHGAEAAALARPIFEAYANSQSREVDSDSDQKSSPNREGKNESGTDDADSPVRVRLVSANVTRELSLEEYVLGVMSTEGTTEAEPEALKALAIAIRTYAVRNRGRHAKEGFDFCSTTHCQRFGGIAAAADSRISAAVRATEGQVLLDDHDQVVDSYFGASCGGETANLGTLWGKTPPEYLKGVRDEFCTTGPHATWTDVITRADLLRALQSDARTSVGSRLDRLEITKRDETGRAEFITLDGEQRKTIRGWDFKIIVGRVLGWNVLKSSRFEVFRSGSNFIFRGSGFGHGLGLCQEGAHAMAARGIGYQRILEKYFPGTRVGKGVAALPQRSAVSLRLTGAPAQNYRGYASMTPGAASIQIIDSSGEASLTAPCCGKAAPLRSVAESYWRADLFPALKDWAEVTLLYAATPSGPTRFITISSEHFSVSYPADVARREADQVLSMLESTRADFLRRASSASISANIPSLSIRFNDSTGDFVGRTGQPWWAAAATKGNRIETQPLALLKRRGVLTTTLRHELAHAIIDNISRDRAPRWLEEGFAIYLAGEGSMFSNYVKRGAITIEELERRLEHPRTQQEMRSLYAQAYITVSQMARNEGEASVWRRVAGS